MPEAGSKLQGQAGAEKERPRIGLIGSGRLADATATLFSREYSVARLGGYDPANRPVNTDSRLHGLVAVNDGWDTRPISAMTARVRVAGIPGISAHIEVGRAVIGPVIEPGAAGCATCVESRKQAAPENLTHRIALRARHGDRLAAPFTWITPFGAAAVASILAEETTAAITGASPRTRGSVIHLELNSLAIDLRGFLPDPSCPQCGELPDDSAESAVIVLQSRPKLTRSSYRVRKLADLDGLLSTTYVDDEIGLIRRIEQPVTSVYPNVSALVGIGKSSGNDAGFGRSLDYQTSRLTAIAEALERFGGAFPRGKRTVVRGCFGELAEHAIDPKTLGLYTDERYALPDFRFQRYHDGLELRWVWGYSFAAGAPVLVPENYAYYRTHLSEGADQPFVYEISNGCAIGCCLEEAILHGILEVVERDAFLMTWYGRLPVPRLDLANAGNDTIRLMAERLEWRTGYELRAFNTTMEHGIPSVWVMALHPADPGQPKTLSAAGSSFDPARAVINALHEVAPMVQSHRGTYPGERNRAASFVANSQQVKQMPDHSLLYCHPGAFHRLDFLFRPVGAAGIEESFAGAFRPCGKDLRDDLTATIERLRNLGLDVIVVDQTAPEHRAGGFTCVKVIIPGMLPMTFGHDARRVDGIPRLREVPTLLGYRQHPLGPGDVNPYPHPFP
jgi:ribosomal protein S12 methylthiotransferase accessory factor